MTQTFYEWAESEGLDMSADWKGELTSPVTAGALRGWEGAQSARQEAVRYFVYDNEYGYNEFKTDAERDAAHRSAIEGYLDDGWSEEVESVVSGIVTHKTVECNVEHAPPRCEAHPEQDGDDCSECAAWNEWPNHEYDYTCSYEPDALAGAPMDGHEASKGAGSGTRTDTPASSPSDDTASQGTGTTIVAARAITSPAKDAQQKPMTDRQIIELCTSVGVEWEGPDMCDFMGGFGRVNMAEMRAIIAAAKEQK